jgi:transcriptional regulator with XRE-family HTH domain
MSKLTKVLRELCKERNVRLADVCKKAKLSYVYILNTESGISFTQFIKLCDVLNLDINDRVRLHSAIRLRRSRDPIVVNDHFVQIVSFKLLKSGKYWTDPLAVCATVLQCAGVTSVTK